MHAPCRRGMQLGVVAQRQMLRDQTFLLSNLGVAKFAGTAAHSVFAEFRSASRPLLACRALHVHMRWSCGIWTELLKYVGKNAPKVSAELCKGQSRSK